MYSKILSDYLETIQPSAQYCKTPPITNWFADGMLRVEDGSGDTPGAGTGGGTDTTRPFHCREHTLESFQHLGMYICAYCVYL